MTEKNDSFRPRPYAWTGDETVDRKINRARPIVAMTQPLPQGPAIEEAITLKGVRSELADLKSEYSVVLKTIWIFGLVVTLAGLHQLVVNESRVGGLLAIVSGLLIKFYSFRRNRKLKGGRSEDSISGRTGDKRDPPGSHMSSGWN